MNHRPYAETRVCYMLPVATQAASGTQAFKNNCPPVQFITSTHYVKLCYHFAVSASLVMYRQIRWGDYTELWSNKNLEDGGHDPSEVTSQHSSADSESE